VEDYGGGGRAGHKKHAFPSGNGRGKQEAMRGLPLAFARGLMALSIACAALSSFGCRDRQSTVAAPEASAATPSPNGAGALLQPGAPAPEVRLHTHTGETLTLAALRGRPVVVYFYPKDDTPGCTVEAQEIRDLWSEIQTTSAIVIGVSTDDADSHRAFAEKHALPFHLAADTDGSIARAFGVPLRNGRATRVSFVIDEQGRIARVFPEVTPRGHGRELLEAVRALE